MSDIHQFLRYSISGYFFLVLFWVFLFFLNFDFLKDSVFYAVIFAISGYPVGFVFHQIHFFWYWEKEGGMKKWLFDILEIKKENQNDEHYYTYRAAHDNYLFQDKFKELSERIIFVSSAFYMYGSLMVSVFVFYIFIFLASLHLIPHISIPMLKIFQSPMNTIIFYLSVLSLFWFREERKRHRKLLINLERIFVNEKENLGYGEKIKDKIIEDASKLIIRKSKQQRA